MKISTTIGFDGDPQRLAQQAQDLESAGVDLLWGAEIYGYDLISTLGYIAAKTERVELMTGIIPLYSRSPALIAQTAATLDALSGGRFILGLGTSGPQVIEGWHGVPFEKPMARTRDTIEICRKVWSGDKLTHDGKSYKLPFEGGTGLGKPIKFMNRPPANDIRIGIASIGPRTSSSRPRSPTSGRRSTSSPTASSRCGAMPSPRARPSAIPEKKPLEIIAGGFVAIGKGDHIQEARDAARGLIGFYVGGMGAKGKNFYNDLFKRYGWEQEAEEIQDLFLSGKRAEAMAAVPEEYIDLSALIGDEGYVRERLQVFKEVGVTHLNVNAVGPDSLATFEKLKAWSE